MKKFKENLFIAWTIVPYLLTYGIALLVVPIVLVVKVTWYKVSKDVTKFVYDQEY